MHPAVARNRLEKVLKVRRSAAELQASGDLHGADLLSRAADRNESEVLTATGWVKREDGGYVEYRTPA